MRSLVCTILIVSACQAATANEGLDLSSRARSSAAAPQPRSAEAPFRAARDPYPEILLREEQERRGPRGNCQENATALCYDLADGRVVYRPARQYMPQFEGLRAESVSLRRDRVIFKYSFR